MRRHNRTRSRVLEIVVLLALPVAVHYLFPCTAIVSRPYSFAGLPLMLLGFGLPGSSGQRERSLA